MDNSVPVFGNSKSDQSGFSLSGDILQPALVGIGAGSQMGAGLIRAYELKRNASQQETLARQDLLNAKAQEIQLRQQLQENFATQQARFAARGIGLGSGSVQAVASRSANNVGRDISNIKMGAKASASRRRFEKRLLKGQSKTARLQGYMQGFSTLGRSLL